MELNQYLSMFIDESKEHLQAINENLLLLEQAPGDIEIVQVIFRSAHTLKGMSATMGYGDVAKLTHEMENVLDMVRNRKLTMDSIIIDCLFKSTDVLESMVNDIIEGGTGQAEVSEIVLSLQDIVNGNHLTKDSSIKPDSGHVNKDSSSFTSLDQYQYSIVEQSLASGFQVYNIEVGIKPDCILKAARAYMVFDVFDQHGEVIKSTPSIQDIEQEKFDLSFSVIIVSEMTNQALEGLVARVSEVDYVKTTVIDHNNLSSLQSQASGTSANQTEQSPASEALMQESEAIVANNGSSTSTQASKTAAQTVVTRTIRVDIERLDRLMNLFSEMLIDRVRLEQLATEISRQDLTETVEHMARVSNDLQNIVLKLRMVPVETVFNRFPRMVRDVAKSLNKKVELIISGADTELDRTVVEEISDPLVHLLRNSIDHGIESVAERVKADKSETGTIWLRAFHSGNHVYIEIEDDGHGIDRQRVLQTAIQRGIVSEDQTDRMSDDEVAVLLFASGFSTANKISDISGRGVGLDVVKTKIQSLGGVVEVQSKPDKGTKFSIQLPLTLSIISAMLIRVNQEKFAIPLSSIVETASVHKDRIRLVHGIPMIDFREHVVPLINLSQVYNVPDCSEKNSEETEIVIVKKGEKLAALMVSELIGQQEIVLKNLGEYLGKVAAVSGATILGDGQVALILDTNSLLK